MSPSHARLLQAGRKFFAFGLIAFLASCSWGEPLYRTETVEKRQNEPSPPPDSQNQPSQGGGNGDGDDATAETDSLKVIAPGGSGAITAVAESPKKIILVGTELNGVFRSTDGGKSFENVSHDLRTRRVLDVKIVSKSGREHAYLATDEGIWHSDDASGKLGDDWEEWNTGLQSFCPDSTSNCTSRYSHPVQIITVDPGAPDTMYAGIGETMLGNTVTTYRPQATEPKVYKTVDGGKNWTPILYLPGVSSLTEDTSGGIVYGIHVDVKSSSKVAVATDMGLYLSYDGGAQFYRMGARNAYTSKDKGASWSSCVSNTSCRTEYQSKGTCASGATTGGCLPVNAEVNESHPNLRYTYWENGILYALVLDTGWAGGTAASLGKGFDTSACTVDGANFIDCLSSCSSSDSAMDTDNLFFRGGPWYSTDNGLTWAYSNPNNTTMPKTTPQVRCNPTDTLEDSTNYSFMAVNPSDSGHFILGAPFVRGHTSGIYEVKGGSWTHLRETCKDSSCYEGGEIGGLWTHKDSVAMPGIFGMTVAQWDPVTVYSGQIMGLWKITGKGTTYSIEHLDQDQNASDPDYWGTTGIDLHCPHGGVASLGEALFVGAIDVGVLKSKDEGKSWKRVTEANQDLIDMGLHLDNTSVLIKDEKAGVLYANNYWNGGANDDTNTMLVSDATGETWTPIGGQLYNGECDKSTALSCVANGLPKTFDVLTLALDQSREANRLLFAGGQDKSVLGGGIYVYDPSINDSVADQWSALDGDGCSALKGGVDTTVVVNSIIPSPDDEHVFFATVTDLDNVGGQKSMLTAKEGVYAIEVSTAKTFSCRRVLSASDDQAPMAVKAVSVALASDGSTRLVAAGEYQNWPVIWSTPFDYDDPAASDWSITLDFDPDKATDAAQSWWSYLSGHSEWKGEYEYTYANRKEFSSLVTDPSQPKRVLATMWDSPGTDGHAVRHVYRSDDGGATFSVAEEFEVLPVKTLKQIQFSEDEEHLYLSGKCSSLYRMPNPYRN